MTSYPLQRRGPTGKPKNQDSYPPQPAVSLA